jgi:hypothetical protein
MAAVIAADAAAADVRLTSHHSFHHSFSRACFHLKFSRDLIYNESIGGFLINVLCGEQTT